MRQVRISTKDNPHNPFDKPVEWVKWDAAHFKSMNELARHSYESETLSEFDNQRIREEAIDYIIDNALIPGAEVIKVVREVP